MFSPVRTSPMNKSKRNQRYEKTYSRQVQGTPRGFWFPEQSAIFFHFVFVFLLFFHFLPGVAWSSLDLFPRGVPLANLRFSNSSS